MLLDTDSPIDKIIGYITGSVTIPAFDFNDVTISHGFDVAPVSYVKWSFTNSFTDSYDETPFDGIENIFVSLSTTNSNVIVRCSNNGATVRTLYYRVTLFAQGDKVYSSNNTQTGLDNFNINTDYNYPKLKHEGYLARTGDTFNHNLGYIPQVDAWLLSTLYGGSNTRYMISSMRSTPVGTFESRLTITESQIIFTCPSPMTSDQGIYFRIYGDHI